MLVISKKCRTLKPKKAEVHYVPYKTYKLKVFFDGNLKLNSIAKWGGGGGSLILPMLP